VAKIRRQEKGKKGPASLTENIPPPVKKGRPPYLFLLLAEKRDYPRGIRGEKWEGEVSAQRWRGRRRAAPEKTYRAKKKKDHLPTVGLLAKKEQACL